jgi:hypothetical protein
MSNYLMGEIKARSGQAAGDNRAEEADMWICSYGWVADLSVGLVMPAYAAMRRGS